jgi:ferric-dicitrate binding protein FerR (iron transport regulator)
MAVDPNRINFLLDKFSRNEVNEVEFNELCELLKDDENESDIKRNLIKDIKVASFTELDQAKLDSMLNKILVKEEIPVRRLFPWKRFVAAAAVIIVVAVGSYFAFFRNNEKPTIAKTPVPVQNDLLPGGNKAVLTLADGTVVTLDSAKNGALVVQGNTQVIKGDGTLAYNEEQQVGIAQNPVYNTVATPKGGQYQLTLADGSKVWLNAASSIHFPTAFTGNERRVDITGEAYFEVVHNANKPFHVNVNGMDVQVLGTHFNINAYTDEESIKTTLLEGSVKVSAANKTVTIKPGEQAQMNGGNAIGLVVSRDVNVDQVMAWKNGTFNFDGADLQTIMRQITRWYDVDVSYQGKIPTEPFKGEISRNVPASKVLQMLEYLGVKFRIEGKKIVVMQ